MTPKIYALLGPLCLFLVLSAVPMTAQSESDAASLGSFVGTWKGICADGNEFLVLTLSLGGAGLEGSVSIANMNGEDGQCHRVNDPPSPEHAMKISNPQLQGAALGFKGSDRARFEMSVTGRDRARLKFLGTPVENQPWELKRVK